MDTFGPPSPEEGYGEENCEDYEEVYRKARDLARFSIGRHGDSLILGEMTNLPPRCYLTNLQCSAAEALTYKSSPKWVAWAVYLLAIGALPLLAGIVLVVDGLDQKSLQGALGSVLVGLVIAAFLKRPEHNPIEFTYYHSFASRRSRRWRRWISGSLTLIGFLAFVIPLFVIDHSPPRTFLLLSAAPGALALFVGMATFWFSVRSLKATKFIGNARVLQGCGEPFLSSFPNLNFIHEH